MGGEKERKALAVSCSEEIVSALLPALRSVTEKLTFDQRRDYFTDEYRLWAENGYLCRQAVKAFSGEDTRERSKIILLHFMDRFSGELYVLKNLFEEKSVDLTRDKEFLIALMRSRQGVFLWPVFLTLLCEWDGDPTPYAAALAAACGTMAEEAGRPQRFWLHSRDLAQCVLRTLDRFPENSQVRELCLSLWDELYRADIVWARQLSGMLDRME